MKNNFYFFIILLFTFCSCSSLPKETVPNGRIITEGVEIRAEDNSFVLKYNEIWKPPYQNVPTRKIIKNNVDMVPLYKDAIQKMGAKKVRVKVPYQSEELYGVLLLSQTYEHCSSSTTRSYQISIPANYVEAAQNGRISVLYEYYDCRVNKNAKALMIANPWAGIAANKKKTPKTWVLWLSDIPFE